MRHRIRSCELLLATATLIYRKRSVADFCKSVALYAALFLAAAFAALSACANVLLLKKDARDFELVVHAGGGGYLNSCEVASSYIDAGFGYIELDFLYTADGALVCSHRFEFGGYSLDFRPTLEEFLQTPVGDGYTGLTLQSLLGLLERNRSFRVIFDTKESDAVAVLRDVQSACVRENIDFYERFIVQLYSERDYLALRGEPFSELWFTNYKAEYSAKTIEKIFGGDARVKAIVLSLPDWAKMRPFGLPEGKKIAVHTVNDAAYIRFLGARGVDYIFTDG